MFGIAQSGQPGGYVDQREVDMSIVEFVAIAVIAVTALAFAVVLATEASQRRELRRLRVAAAVRPQAPGIVGERGAKAVRPYSTI
jgi:phosphotransferase system  glucose/maltose/N-acetylglucosamine-specific IIC component